MNKHSYFFCFLFVMSLLFQNAIGQNNSPYWSLAGNSNATSTSILGTTNSINVRLYTNNLERLRILGTNGYVGIGTLAPTERLHINSASGANPFRVQVNGNTKLFVHSGGGVAIGANIVPPSNGLYVAGNVGIGTTTLNARLTVNAASGNSPFSAQINGVTKLYVAPNGGLSVATSTTPPANGLYVPGSVGIGTSTPTAALDVNGNALIEGSLSVPGGIVVNRAGSEPALYGNGYIGLKGEGTFGVYGYSPDYRGVHGLSATGVGVDGFSTNWYGGYFESSNSYGLVAQTGTGYYAGVFYGNVYTSGTFQTSDRSLKQNAQEFSDAMSIIEKLKPRRYEYKQDEKYAFLHLPKGSHYGLMAQDVEAILPELVSKSDHENVEKRTKTATVTNPNSNNGFQTPVQQPVTKDKPETITIKALNYIELIPIVIKGMQEQEAHIQKQEQLIETLLQRIDALENKSGNQNNLATTLLSQATPNPVKSNTRIGYTVPANSRAQLLLIDAAGKTIKTIALTNSGSVNVNTIGLSSGVYTYSLIIDGKLADTKKLIINH